MDYKFKFGTRISLWLAVVLVALAFAGGVFAGGMDLFPINNSKGIIRGVSLSNSSLAGTSTKGIILNSEGKIPAYLTKDVDFNLFWEVWDIVKGNYYQQNVPDTQLFYGALNGMVNSLNDPYSVFMTPQDSTSFQQDLQGNFEGIGAEIAVKNNLLTVISPLPDSPALKAGLKPNDYILKINGSSTENFTVNQGVGMIRGAKGTKVTLTVMREGFSEPKDFTITRENINVKSVSLEYKSNNVAYIKVRQFNDDTMPLFDQAASEIKSKNVKRLVIDLRNNPGGYLQTAIDMIGEWVNGQVAVIERRNDGTETKHVASGASKLENVSTVILVDEGSASASEIVAGALQDYGKATLVGAKTFGKGSVQDLITLSNGSAIKITVAHWFTPKGRSIEQQGIEPDMKIELSEEDFNTNKDPQLDKAIELLSK